MIYFFQNKLITPGFETAAKTFFVWCLGHCFKLLLWLASSKEPKIKDMITAWLEIIKLQILIKLTNLRQQSLLISLKILQNTNIKRHFTHVLIALKKQNSYFVILMLFTSQKILSLFKHRRNKTPTSLSTSSNYTNVDLGKGIITLTFSCWWRKSGTWYFTETQLDWNLPTGT